MRTSDSIQKISAALAKALPEIQHATKDAENPHFRSSYASLPAVIDTSKPVLAAHGIVVLQAPGWDGERCTVTTRFLHESGEWIEGEAASPVAKLDPQGIGSAITYLRRYSLAGMAGIGQEDDDGNAASEKRDANGKPYRKPARSTNSSGPEITCPACSGPMWDNRTDELAAVNGGKRPDLKCKDKECDTAIWLGSVRDDLKTAMEQALQADILTDAERERSQVVIESYKEDPAALLKALDYMREKMLRAQGAGA